jgi:preprotein translocase subunit SecA
MTSPWRRRPTSSARAWPTARPSTACCPRRLPWPARRGVAPLACATAYTADITYGTNNEFGFDYLRDNMAFSGRAAGAGALSYAIVDEVDSILIDEARTPLIISGAVRGQLRALQVDRSSSWCHSRSADHHPERGRASRLRPRRLLRRREDAPGGAERGRPREGRGMLDREGLLEEGESLYDAQPVLMHHVYGAARPRPVPANVDYIVRDGQMVIVDEFTGRTMPAGAGPRACTRPSRPRRGGDPAGEPDPGLDHLPEPISASTTSSPA